MICVHYIESAIAHKRGVLGYMGDCVVNLKGYTWKPDFLCPFEHKRGAFVKKIKFKKIVYTDAYFFL